MQDLFWSVTDRNDCAAVHRSAALQLSPIPPHAAPPTRPALPTPPHPLAQPSPRRPTHSPIPPHAAPPTRPSTSLVHRHTHLKPPASLHMRTIHTSTQSQTSHGLAHDGD
eukprot:353404-Chlamydomonas_euryale.AAC.10